MVGDLITRDGQLELADIVYSFHTVEGLDMPALRTNDAPRPQDHGTYPGTDRYGGRTTRWTLDMEGLSDVDIQARVGVLQAGLQVRTFDLLPLAYQLRGQNRRLLFVKPRRLSWTGDESLFALRAPTLIFEVYSPDPRIYDQQMIWISGGLPFVSGGTTFPATFPLTFTSTPVSSGIFVANNAGTFPTRPVATIQGPVVDPRIENITAGKQIRFSGLTMTITDTLIIDFDARTVVLNGTASRYSLLASDSAWWELLPGDNYIRFGSTGYDASASLLLAYRSAWI